jgi:pseudouridine synthase
VAEFFSGLSSRVYPVGRLDMDTEGLLILTNDGELARRLMHPSFHVKKTYRVKVKGKMGRRAVDRLAGGEIILGDKPVAPAEVEVIKTGSDRTWLSLTLIEGRHRQIKRMCSQVGHPVLKLKRTSYGPLTLARLKPGQLRPLDSGEVRALQSASGKNPQRAENPDARMDQGFNAAQEAKTKKAGSKPMKKRKARL